MGLPACLRLPILLWRLPILASCLLFVAGCNNTCGSFSFNGTSSSGNVTVSSQPPSCTLNGATGIVSMAIGSKAETKPTPGSMRAPLGHLFVTLAGVDVHPSAIAEDNSPGWQPLAAQFQEHPAQVDLLADTRAMNSSSAFPDAVMPAGLYGQMRLRLAVPPANGQFPGANLCGGQTLHCAVTSDGRVLPLRFLESATNIRIRPENINGQRLYVPPNSATALTIELDLERSFFLPLGDSFLFAPVFHVIVQGRSEIAAN